MAYQQTYGNAVYVPPKKRGMKRIIFGILGLVAAGIGLIVMPILATIISSLIMMGSASPTTISSGDTIDLKIGQVAFVMVPEEEASSATCSAEVGNSEATQVQPTDENTSFEVTNGDQKLVSVMQIASGASDTATITCDGASTIAYAQVNGLVPVVGLIIGVILPIVLGFFALILLIWGIIARVRS